MEVALPVPVGQMTVDLPVVRHFLLLLPGTCINSLGLFLWSGKISQYLGPF